MFKVAMGQSEDADTSAALEDVFAQCDATLGNDKPNSGLVFASTSYDYPELLNAITQKYPGIQLAGCSSYGEITSMLNVSEDSLALLLIVSDQIKTQSGLITDIAKNAYANAYNSIQQSLHENIDQPALCCLFADGIQGNVSQTIEGLQKFLGKKFPIVGGNACDDWKFEKVYQFYKNTVQTGAASFLVLSEPLKTSTCVKHGRIPFNATEKYTVTRSEGNVVYTINNMSTLDFYKSQIGILDSYEPYALLVFSEESERYFIRSPFRIFPEDGSFFFSGDVPQGASINISKLPSPAEALQAADVCVKNALENFQGKKIDLALIFSCALRKEILGTDTPQEIEIIKNQLPKNTPIFGFYTYGEIGPFDPNQPSIYHNETIVVSLIGE